MLELIDVRHRYADAPVLRDISLVLGEGRIGCLLGPSGCGKTTALRAIAGFERIESGEIRTAGALLSAVDAHEPPERRRIGMVFQDYALLPHLDARDNVAFALHDRSPRKARAAAARFLKLVGLEGFERRFPHELSGGQQQRVAIARALAPEPRLLLMDEPFSNLDVGLRQSLGQELRELLKQLGATALAAMHDHHDAFAVADDIGVLRDGELLQWGGAWDLYHRPNDRFVAGFVGKGVWLAGRIAGPGAVDTAIGRIEGRMTADYPANTEIELLLRPDDVVHDDDSPTQARVLSRQFKGSEFLYELETAGGVRLLSSVPSHHNHPAGEAIGIRLETDHIVVFPKGSAA